MCNRKVRDHTSELFYNLNCLKLPELISWKSLCVMYKAKNNLLPIKIKKYFVVLKAVHSHNTRSSSKDHLYPAAVANDGIEVGTSVQAVTSGSGGGAAPISGEKGGSCHWASTDAASFVRTLVLVFLTNATVGNSSPPFSPNCVHAECSQDVPEEDSLFNVSPLSPGLLFLPSRGGQLPPAEGVLLPTTLEDFDDSVLGDPITYARCEHFPGSESPLSLPVYAWPSGSTFLLAPTVIQTVLASETSSLAPAGTSAAAPPIDLGDGRLLETELPGCPYRFSESGGLPFSDENPAYGLQIHHPRFLEFVGAPESARLLDCSPTFWVDQLGKEQAMVAAINLQRDARVMLSNLQILSQFAMALHRMSFSMMAWALDSRCFREQKSTTCRRCR